MSTPSTWSADASVDETRSLDKLAPKAFVFMAQPGHSYTVYFTAAASGSGRDGLASAQLTVDSMKGMQVQF